MLTRTRLVAIASAMTAIGAEILSSPRDLPSFPSPQPGFVCKILKFLLMNIQKTWIYLLLILSISPVSIILMKWWLKRLL